MSLEDLAAGLDDLSRNREALTLLILQGERAVPFLAEGLLGPPSPIPDARCLAAEGLGAIGGEAAMSALIRAPRAFGWYRSVSMPRSAAQALISDERSVSS